MKSFIKKVLATSVMISLGGGIFNINPVSAATIWYDLKFFNNSGGEVGVGEFRYNPDTSTCIQEELDGDSCNEMNGFSVTTELTGFSANILGTEWRLRDRAGQVWWDETTSTVKEALTGQSEVFPFDRWFFSNNSFNEFYMKGSSGGTWRQQLDYSNVLRGTWIAELKEVPPSNTDIVPEPLTLLGAGVAIGFGAFFKAKLK